MTQNDISVQDLARPTREQNFNKKLDRTKFDYIPERGGQSYYGARPVTVQAALTNAVSFKSSNFLKNSLYINIFSFISPSTRASWLFIKKSLAPRRIRPWVLHSQFIDDTVDLSPLSAECPAAGLFLTAPENDNAPRKNDFKWARAPLLYPQLVMSPGRSKSVMDGTYTGFYLDPVCVASVTPGGATRTGYFICRNNYQIVGVYATNDDEWGETYALGGGVLGRTSSPVRLGIYANSPYTEAALKRTRRGFVPADKAPRVDKSEFLYEIRKTLHIRRLAAREILAVFAFAGDLRPPITKSPEGLEIIRRINRSWMVIHLQRYFTTLKARAGDIARPLTDRFITLEAGLEFTRVRKLVSYFKTRKFYRSMSTLSKSIHLARRTAKTTNIPSLASSYLTSARYNFGRRARAGRRRRKFNIGEKTYPRGYCMRSTKRRK